ncbi:MAG: family 10 glycosylhydrolase, partial [Synechocystis sp.]
MAIANFTPLFRWFRRQTLWLNVLGGLLVTLAIVLPFPLGAQTVFPEIRGVWITNNDTVHFMDQTRTRESVDLLADLNFNTLYPVVRKSGYVLYERAIAKREGIQPFSPKGDQRQDVLADLITQAHRRKLLVLPWFEFGFMAPPFSELVKRHPTWLTQRQDGSQTSISAAGEVVWLNPFRPEVQQFMTELVMEVVHNYDIDGVQFDDHTALPNEFGYDPYTIALYQQETEQAPPKDPKDANWTRWRADKITAFMTQLNLTIKAAKPNILVSLSPATYRLAYNTYLQDWLDWVRKGIVDEVVVQVYRTSLPTFQEPIRRAEFQEAKTKVPTAVGILTGLPTKQVPMPLVTAKVREATGQGMGTAFFY